MAVAARNPGASTSKIRSPACAALLVPSTTASVSQLGIASTTATPRMMNRQVQLKKRRRIWASRSSGIRVKTKP
jgi:hypothetical protein